MISIFALKSSIEKVMDAETIFKKLRFDANSKLLIVNAPAEYKEILKGVSYDVKPISENYDFVQVFAVKQAELENLVKKVGKACKYDCLFWACYPKGTGAIKSDIKRETVWVALELINLRAVTQIAIDDTWSALRGRPSELEHFANSTRILTK
jgi:hypothetical protein